MLRLLAAAAVGPLAIWLIASAIVILGSPMPAHGAEPCKGQWVRASWYGAESGSRTATGDRFDGSGLTAAMPSRRHLGERWRVSYAGKSVVVRVNDIGPAAWTGRGLDLSRAAAQRIGMIAAGTGRVCMERVG